MSNVLVTGGAGYIGAHIVRQLGEAGHRVVVLDDLSTGFRDAVLYGDLVVGDVGDAALVARLLREHDIDAAIHLAACTKVEESVAKPLLYYENNVCKTRTLLDCCVAAGVQRFIFSSSAAVYGIPDEPRASENTPTRPINPYGATKLVGEWMVRDAAAAHGLRHVTLRYFNVAGCDPEGRVGQSTPEATLLVKVACEAAVGKRPYLSLFGTDYPTPDGTAVRDYIHVEDLANAHLQALDYLEKGGESITLNCGYGHGYSVRQVLEAMKRVSGIDFEIRETGRRPGDPPMLLATAERIAHTLGWQPRHDDLDAIIRTSLEWERKLNERSSQAG